MRVLLTRPEPDARETAARLRALGHEVVVAPLLDIAFLPPPADLPEPKAILFTSRNGVRALEAWPQASAWRDRPVFVTGQATAEEARGAGFVDVRSAAGGAAELAEFVIGAVDRQTKPILYPAARDRTDTLLDRLAAGGYHVLTVEAYRAEMVTSPGREVLDQLRAGAIQGALFYSNRTAAAFRAVVDRWELADHLRMTVLYALSDRVAEPLRGLPGWIRVASHADEESLLALLPRVLR